MSAPGTLPAEQERACTKTEKQKTACARVYMRVSVHMQASMCVEQMGGKKEIREG